MCGRKKPATEAEALPWNSKNQNNLLCDDRMQQDPAVYL